MKRKVKLIVQNASGTQALRGLSNTGVLHWELLQGNCKQGHSHSPMKKLKVHIAKKKIYNTSPDSDRQTLVLQMCTT